MIEAVLHTILYRKSISRLVLFLLMEPLEPSLALLVLVLLVLVLLVSERWSVEPLRLPWEQ